MKEKIIERKQCGYCQSNFDITDKDLEFYDKVSPIFNGKKYNIPSPVYCPECREKERISFRNRRNLYKRKCDHSGKDILSMYSPDKSLKVFHSKYWESDRFDASDYFSDFDFSESFFGQYKAFQDKVPLPHLAVIEETLENSDYVNGANGVKNSYLCNNIVDCDSAYYSEGIYHSERCIDCDFVTNCRESYSCLNSEKLFNCCYCNKSDDLYNCYYLHSCKGCKNCFGCINLINREYCIFNKQYSKEEYNKKIDEVKKNTTTETIFSFFITQPNLYSKIIGSTNSFGDYIFNSKNCLDSFNIIEGENIKYSSFVVDGGKDLYDISFWGENISKCYGGTAIGLNATNILFSRECYNNVSNLIYCTSCSNNVSNCFACIGLKNKSYCIFNKQYTKQEYSELVPKIIEKMRKDHEWGNFFPSSLSTFGYNETLASEYFPLEKNEALKLGFNWSDYEVAIPSVDKIILADKLPENIKDIPDDILNWAVVCEVSKKPFRIISQELEFYRKHNLPIPKRHPEQRHLDRMNLRNPRKLFDRKCDKCSIGIKTTYSPDMKEIVYCEECYNNEVY